MKFLSRKENPNEQDWNDWSGCFWNWSYTAEIIKAVAAGGDYTVIGFGKFYASQRQARTGRNPSTGAEIKIPAAMVPKFTAGKAFKDAVNAPKRPARKARAKAKK